MPSNKKRVRILVVDDEILVNEFVQTQLTQIGYEVVGSAFDGPEAVKMTCELRPDIVLMDLRMHNPKTHREDHTAGLQAAQKIQEQCPTPVVLLTAYESPELVQRASSAGIGAYLIKPVSDNELDRALSIALARANDLAEMRRLNAELQAHNEELDAFAYTVAHDIKHQLSISTGYAELLEMDHKVIPEDKLAQYIHEIVISGRKLNRIVSELLLLARVRKVDELDLDRIKTGQIVKEAQIRLRDLVEKHKAQFTIPKSWPKAIGYAPWIEEVWVNYISNGIKYGGNPPHLTLGAEKTSNGTVRFWVHDNGSGLTPEQQAQVFTPFERFSQIRVEGQGLGLSIVHRIVTKLGGNVGVESTPGEGSTFYFTLPAK